MHGAVNSAPSCASQPRTRSGGHPPSRCQDEGGCPHGWFWGPLPPVGCPQGGARGGWGCSRGFGEQLGGILWLCRERGRQRGERTAAWASSAIGAPSLLSDVPIPSIFMTPFNNRRLPLPWPSRLGWGALLQPCHIGDGRRSREYFSCSLHLHHAGTFLNASCLLFAFRSKILGEKTH